MTLLASPLMSALDQAAQWGTEKAKKRSETDQKTKLSERAAFSFSPFSPLRGTWSQATLNVVIVVFVNCYPAQTP